MPAASNAPVGHEPRQRRRSILRRCPKPAAHQLEHPLRVGVDEGPGRRRRRSRPAPSRPGAGAGTRPAHPAHEPGGGPGTRPAPTGCRRCGRPARRPAAPPPPAAPSPASGSMAGAPSSRSSTSGVATLYGRLATRVHARRAGEQRGPVERHRVALAPPAPRPERLHRLPQHRQTWRSSSSGDHRGAGLGQRQGERPRTGAHLDHVVTGPHAGEPGDAPHRVRVDDEVLPERARLGVTPCSARSACSCRRVWVTRAGLPGDANRDHAGAERREGLEARRRQVDDVRPEGPPVVHRARDLPARGDGRDRHDGALRQREVGAAAGRAALVPGGGAGLGVASAPRRGRRRGWRAAWSTARRASRGAAVVGGAVVGGAVVVVSSSARTSIVAGASSSAAPSWSTVDRPSWRSRRGPRADVRRPADLDPRPRLRRRSFPARRTRASPSPVTRKTKSSRLRRAS